MSKRKAADEKIRTITPFGVRMPNDLKSRILAAARRNNRSANAEIVERLRASLETHVDLAKDAIATLDYLYESKDFDKHQVALLKRAAMGLGFEVFSDVEDEDW